MKMKKVNNVLVLVLATAVFSLVVVGCQNQGEHPSKEHSASEHPAPEHPKSEHPKSEHPE